MVFKTVHLQGGDSSLKRKFWNGKWLSVKSPTVQQEGKLKPVVNQVCLNLIWVFDLKKKKKKAPNSPSHTQKLCLDQNCSCHTKAKSCSPIVSTPPIIRSDFYLSKKKMAVFHVASNLGGCCQFYGSTDFFGSASTKPSLDSVSTLKSKKKCFNCLFVF